MIKKLTFCIGLSFLFGACQWFKTYDFSVKTMEKYASDCTQTDSTDCAVVSLNYIECKRPLGFAEKFNDTIRKRIFRILGADFELSKDIDTAINDFLEDYEFNKKIYPKMPPYEVNLWDTISFENKHLVCLKSNVYKFTAGAHGYASTSYFNFKPSGECYSPQELFTDKNNFIKVAERYFRKSQNIEGVSINDNGYWFEDDVFDLPQNIGFVKDTLILHYNPYEIAPYATGETIVKIPVKEVKQYISIFNQ